MASQSDSPETPSIKAQSFLSSLLGRQMRLSVSDERIFAGEFKCTDNVGTATRNISCVDIRLIIVFQECNIILASAYEYRPPTPSAVAATVAAAAEPDKVKVDMTSRFMGLVVVPGKHVTRVEIDE